MSNHESTIYALCRFFEGTDEFSLFGLDKLPLQYIWPKKGDFPSLPYLELLGSNFEKNIQLKSIFRSLWDKHDHLELAKWIVSDWGGIKGNKIATLQKFVTEIDNNHLELSITGVASYSKMLSFIYPEQYAIYDARVAASLNIIQMLSGSASPSLWCDLPGRNSLIEDFKRNEGNRRKLKTQGWTPINRDDCYTAYNNVLKTVQKSIPNAKLYEMEMSLFACAEDLIMLLRK